MTPFQKQVLMLEEERQNEQAQQQQGGGASSPSGALNARRGDGYQERIHYENEQTYETENQVEFVE